MPVNQNYGVNREFYSAEQGKQFASYDLTGRQQKVRRVFDILNKHVPEFTDILANHTRRTFNCEELLVQYSEWMATAPDNLGVQIRAFPEDQRDHEVILGTDPHSLFRLSELFFGGEPDKLADKQLESRKLVETERRLLNKILEMVLRALGPLLGYGLDAWQCHWPVSDATVPGFCHWLELKFSGDNWQASLNLGWPQSLGLPDEGAPSPDATLFRLGLEKGLCSVRTALTVEIAAVDIPLGQIDQLTPGDILPLSLSEVAVAKAQSNELLEGTVCENGEQLALRITRYLGVNDDRTDQ